MLVVTILSFFSISLGWVLGWAPGNVLGCGVLGVSAANISAWGITTPAAVKNDAIAALVNNFFFINFFSFFYKITELSI